MIKLSSYLKNDISHLQVHNFGIEQTYNQRITEISIEEVMSDFFWIKEATKNGRKPLLVDISKITSMSREARNFYTDIALKKHVSAIAFVVDEGPARVIANIIMHFNKVIMPIKIFDSNEAAAKWLMPFSIIEN